MYPPPGGKSCNDVKNKMNIMSVQEETHGSPPHSKTLEYPSSVMNTDIRWTKTYKHGRINQMPKKKKKNGVVWTTGRNGEIDDGLCPPTQFSNNHVSIDIKTFTWNEERRKPAVRRMQKKNIREKKIS